MKGAFAMFNPAAFENSRPDGFSVLEVVGGEGEPRMFVPLKRTVLRGEVVGPLASMRLVQTFGYTRAECDRVLEAVYRFPLPGDAAVSDVTVRFGNVEIRAELKERERAEEEYAEARKQGRQAALATRESPDVFTLQVAGIQPDEEVIVETGYVQLARAEGPGWTLRIPLTTSPRYTRSDEATARHAQGQPLFLMRDPGHRFALDLAVRGAEAVESATHRLDVSAEEDGLRVRLADGEVVPDRDCVLAWQPERHAEHPALHAVLHDDPDSGQVYFLALAAPPAARLAGGGPAREVALLVDHSGSMEGPKWEAADWAVKRFLAGLSERDAFALCLFHNRPFWFAKTMQPAVPAVVEKAVAFLESHKDSGGTELGVTLEQALDLKRAPGERARHVLVVTDAQVTDEGRLLRMAEEESRRADRRRISLLCIDAAPNALLANELAERGGGAARFLTSDPEEEDITTALDEVLADWAEPVYMGLRLEVNRPEAAASGRETVPAREEGRSAVDLGDMPGGRAVWVAGRVPRGEAPSLMFRLTDGAGREIASCRIGASEPRPALKALFGARRVLALEFLMHSYHDAEGLRDRLRRLGCNPDAILPGKAGRQRVYAENVRADIENALRGLLAREALDYGLASSETAFVAIRMETGKPIEGTVAVANALPSGWSEEFAVPVGVRLRAGGVRYFSLSAPAAYADADLSGFSAGAVAREMEPDIMTSLSISPAREQTSRRLSVREAVVFSGVPAFANGAAILFDTARPEDAAHLPDDVTFTRLAVRFPGGAPDPSALPSALELLLYVDDLSAPRARARLADILRQGGERPLNLRRPRGMAVRIVLVCPDGVWPAGAAVEVALGW
jgi:Ca-activated chloride channel family protein